ncbi:hypothetical protein HN747_02150 [archaeon]|jgi:hypothetical protein|nr:hypothetical protein [archaeon]
MKTGYKHNTAIFGTDAEQYIARLFMMTRNPNGCRRPDLISPEGSFDPRLSLEVKSGSMGKGILVDYQLQYPFTIANDYSDIFGEDLGPSSEQNLFSQIESVEVTHPQIAYYYDIIGRSKKVTSKHLDESVSSAT